MSDHHRFIEPFVVLCAAVLCSCIATSDSDDAEVVASHASALVSVGVGGGDEEPSGCPEEDGPIPVFLPDPTDCSKYYECSNGVPISNECTGELVWNPELHTCDFPGNVECPD